MMHFCAGLPIILVGCKKDLRRDSRVVEELRRTGQRPVTPEEVRLFPSYFPFLFPQDANDPVSCPGYGCGEQDWG